MAAGLGYKEFATGDVLTAADANGYLASQVVMVFASAAARSSAIASPQEGMISYLKDTNATEYYSGSAWVAIGGGKVLQVVQGTSTTATTIATTTMTDTTITATITPTSATSKILVMISAQFSASRSSGNIAIGAKVLRGATTIQDFGTYGFSQITATGATAVESTQIRAQTYLDSPATTSATTYKLQAAPNTTANSAQVIFQVGSFPSSIILIEVGA